AARPGNGTAPRGLRLVAEPRSRVPVPLTTFVGRERELGEVQVLIGRHRLVTVTGPGGSGKTRLMLELLPRLAPSLPDGVTFVELAPLADSALVAPRIADALGIREMPDQTVALSLERSIGERRMLVVLDNFEHLMAGAPLVAALLAACPALSIVV